MNGSSQITKDCFDLTVREWRGKSCRKWMMTWSWQWHENLFSFSFFWDRFLFLAPFSEDRRQEQVSVASVLIKSRKFWQGKNGVCHFTIDLARLDFILVLILCKMWKVNATKNGEACAQSAMQTKTTQIVLPAAGWDPAIINEQLNYNFKYPLHSL